MSRQARRKGKFGYVSPRWVRGSRYGQASHSRSYFMLKFEDSMVFDRLVQRYGAARPQH